MRSQVSKKCGENVGKCGERVVSLIAKTYEKFLDRYLKIVPAYSFGLGKKELLPNEELKKYLGY